MATIPTTASFTTGEVVTAAKLTAQTKTVADFLMSAPNFQVRRTTTTQSIANSTTTSVQFTTEDYDNDAMFAVGTSATNVTINTAGWWHIRCSVEWQSSGTGFRDLRLVGGSTIIGESTIAPPTGITCFQHLSGLYYISAGTVLTMQVTQNSGGALTINTSTTGTTAGATLSGRWIGA